MAIGKYHDKSKYLGCASSVILYYCSYFIQTRTDLTTFFPGIASEFQVITKTINSSTSRDKYLP